MASALELMAEALQLSCRVDTVVFSFWVSKQVPRAVCSLGAEGRLGAAPDPRLLTGGLW